MGAEEKVLFYNNSELCKIDFIRNIHHTKEKRITSTFFMNQDKDVSRKIYSHIAEESCKRNQSLIAKFYDTFYESETPDDIIHGMFHGKNIFDLANEDCRMIKLILPYSNFIFHSNNIRNGATSVAMSSKVDISNLFTKILVESRKLSKNDERPILNLLKSYFSEYPAWK